MILLKNSKKNIVWCIKYHLSVLCLPYFIRTIFTGKFPSGQFPPGKLPPRQLPPRIIPTWKNSLPENSHLDDSCKKVSNFALPPPRPPSTLNLEILYLEIKAIVVSDILIYCEYRKQNPCMKKLSFFFRLLMYQILKFLQRLNYSSFCNSSWWFQFLCGLCWPIVVKVVLS